MFSTSDNAMSAPLSGANGKPVNVLSKFHSMQRERVKILSKILGLFIIDVEKEFLQIIIFMLVALSESQLGGFGKCLFTCGKQVPVELM